MRKPNFIKSFFAGLLLVTVIHISIADTPIISTTTLVDKITFRVDMRLQSVNGGVYIAGSFMDQVGLAIWTQVAMCDLGSGIYEISFVGVAPGLYQYKFLNGPGGWEFNGFGGPCTNPLDNNNRWLNYGGGVLIEGPWCFSTCDLFCSGFGDPGASDTDPPTIDQAAPANTTITCGDPLPAASALDASDGCDVNATTTTGMPTDDNSALNACGLGNLLRIWEVMDCSGNTTSTTQTITLVDNTAPTINAPIPADVTVSCGSLPAAISLPASDGCDNNVTSTGMPTDDNSGLSACGVGEVIRTWQVSDCSGNTVSASQTITLVDSAAPTITGSAPADVTVSCGSVPAAMSLAATDNCDPGVTSTGMPTDDNSGIGPCGTGQIIRTWEVSDCSGNMFSASQTITLMDNAAPVLTTPMPADITVSCGNIPAAVALPASDACDANVNSTGMPTDDNSGIGLCGTGQIMRTWEVGDCSGNMFSASQTITVTDNAGPTIDDPIPPNVTIECGNPIPVGMPLAASDNCDANVTTTSAPVDDLTNLSFCGTGQIIRTWQAADCSGNMTTATQTITVADTQQPIITEPVPANTTVDCSGIPIGLPLAILDACDASLFFTDVPIDDLSGINSCGLGVVVRTWTVSDCQGNTTVATQLITLEDGTPPIIIEAVPADVTVACGNIPLALPLLAQDGCDVSLLATDLPTDDLSGLSACGAGTIFRTWVATDCSGNSVFANQLITVEDNEPPVLSVPADASLDCNNIPTATASDASATDNCSNPTIIYDGETVVGSGCPYEIHRTWTATDECGNSISASQIITVTDLEAPVLAAPPANVTVCQGAVPAAVDLGWTDNCTGTGNVSPTDMSDGMTDPETITRTWTYTDNCGNMASVSQIITVIAAPAANAGNDQNLCEGETASLSGNVSGGFNSSMWTTSGDGIFQNPTGPNTDYFPGTNDLLNGSVTIYFTAQTNGVGACSQTADSLQLAFVISPAANAGAAQTITCEFPQVMLDGSGSSTGNSYAYEWSGPGINMANRNEQSPTVDQFGSYTLVVTETTSDQNCTAISTVDVFENTTPPTVDAGPDLTLTCTETSVILQGSGTAPSGSITYSWIGPGITAANENLPNPSVSEGGIYTLTVTDTANGCTASDQTEVALDGNLPISDPGPDQVINCNNPTVILDGSNSSAGPGIEYQWFGPNGQSLGTSLMQTVSLGGIFSLQVNDTNNGCKLTATVEVELDTDPPTADAGPDETLTCNQSLVTLGGNSSAGANFQYEWTFGGMPVGSTSTLTAGQSGIYTLNILDTENGCSASDEVTVSQNADLPTANAGPNQQVYCGNSFATLDGSASSSGMNIEYEWTGPSFISNEISPQVGVVGVYYLTVTNTLSACAAVDSVQVTSDSDLPVADAGADTTITCFAPQILLDASNSTQGADIEFEWFNTIGALLGNSLTLLVDLPGIYYLHVTNTQNGCTDSDIIVVGSDALPPTAAAGMDLQFTCTQTTLTLDGTGSSTGQNINYLWTGPGIVGDNTSFMADAVEIGVYTLTVTDIETGCSASDEAVISQNPDVPTAFAGADQAITCLADMATLNGSASPANVVYTWGGPGINAANANEQNPSVIEPGIYTLTVNDPATGCDSPPSQVEVFDQQEFPVASVLVNGNLDCQADVVLLDGSGSAQGDTISYQWVYEGNVLATGPDDTWMAENAGTYVLMVINTVTGCQSTESVAVVDLSDLPPAEITGLATLNCFTEIITLTEIAGSASPNVSLVWSTIGGNILQQNQNGITLDAAGQYIVEVTDLSNNCVQSDTFSVSANLEAPTIIFNNNPSIGCSQTETALEAVVNASTNDLLYEWSGNGFSSNETMPVVTQTGQYNLVVTNNENGCSASSTTTVSQASGIENVFFTTTPPTCFGEADGILQIDSVAGFNPPYTYVFENGPATQTPVFTGLSGGSFTFSVTDTEGCSFVAVFILDEPPMVEVALGVDVEIALGETVQLSPVASPLVSQYVWTNAGSLTCSNCPEPFAQPDETTLYTLTVSDENGCEAVDDILITVNGRVDIYQPNAFSPNDDGINDVFTLFGGPQVLNINTLLVFNRWGDKVYESSDLPPNDVKYGWDGTHKGQVLDAGVYVFYAEITLTSGRVVQLEGEVLLIR